MDLELGKIQTKHHIGSVNVLLQQTAIHIEVKSACKFNISVLWNALNIKYWSPKRPRLEKNIHIYTKI